MARRHQGRLLMSQPNRRAGRGRIRISLWGVLPLLGALLIGVTPITATALPIYESAPNGPLATTLVDPSPFGDPAPVIVADQSLGVKFYVSEPVTTGSIGGYFAPYPGGTESDIIGAIVWLQGSSDFPNSFKLKTSDVLGKTPIHISEVAGNYAGDLSVMLTSGWYALVFAATGSGDEHNATMPRMAADIGDPLYFFGKTTTDASVAAGGQSPGRCSGALEPRGLRSTREHPTSGWGSQGACGPDPWNAGFEYLDGGGLDGVRMFVDSDPATPVPEPSTLLLLGSGLAGLGGVGWRRHRQN
jgi:hypothetical protein